MSRSLCAFGEESRPCQHPVERNVQRVDSPSDAPTPIPTPAPRASAAPSSSVAPTSAPTVSAAPSTSASPTSAPTASAAPSSSASPTSIDDRDPEFPDTCVSDDGNFGETDLSKADQIVTVGFKYQVQTNVTLRNSMVLAQLEEALANFLVPALFRGNELCEFDRRKHLQSWAPAVGLLSAPPDRILVGSEEVRCRTGLVGLYARCFIVRGGFTLLGNGDISWARPLGWLLTKVAMDEGKLNIVNPDVVDVKFLEALNTTIIFNNDTSARPSMSPTSDTTIDPDRDVQSIGSSDNVPGWFWGLVSIGVIAFLVPLLVVARKLGDRKKCHRSVRPE